ncbi:glycerol-3-phosphate 1-O-acyltransferase PlsY [Coxiella endosymbiont of Ornithodoros maritimus]|uniref:glycerol-3-phosphate 1-O-acyltransferase PlsY n=1 Tax=Coxiella endosymbiont of Ornithodoros maritimus TaxID=1656172 RepID=UPI002264BA3D|nr:glycerol-3-phosphate 1-O-acyltransferase PlsY [Coxiella endosymbiont of Ornithodoros maritimus]
MVFIISIIIAYLLGSLSFAVIVAKLMKLADPRTIGSGNAGATNVLRVGGRQAAFYVLLGDAAKGLIAILIARFLNVQGVSLAFVGLVAVLGHFFPVYFKFRGGKGVATMMGVLLGLSFWTGLFVIATWVIVVCIFPYSSVAALVSAVATPICIIITGRTDYIFPVLIIAILIIWKHWENFQRLRKGTEDKIKL